MIDRLARDRLAEGLRHLAAGRSWSEDFEQNCVLPGMKSPDPGVRELAWAAWGLTTSATRDSSVEISSRSRVAARLQDG